MFVFKIILHFKSKCFLARNMKETEEHSLLRIVVYNIQIFFSLSIWMPTGTCLYGNQSEKYKRKTAGYLPHCAGVVLVYMTTKVRNIKETLQGICYVVLVFLATTSETKQRQISCHQSNTQRKHGWYCIISPPCGDGMVTMMMEKEKTI